MANAEIINRKDALTGFHTKEGLNEYLSSRLTSVYDQPKNLTVIILDVDNFKGINDKYGHLVGDDALRYFSMAINVALKGQHFVARYGGDEFVIAMFDSPDGKESLAIANRIKTTLHKEKFNTTTGLIKINTSIGIASYSKATKSLRTLLEAADKALYYAKKHGRNRVVSSRHLTASSLRDKLLVTIKIFFVVGLFLFGFVILRDSKLFSGVTAYFQNISYYAQYVAHRGQAKYDYCNIELTDGRKFEGWIVTEDPNQLFLSLTKPALQLNPFHKTSSLTIKISRASVQSVAKILSN